VDNLWRENMLVIVHLSVLTSVLPLLIYDSGVDGLSFNNAGTRSVG